jgi:hypothetical protein
MTSALPLNIGVTGHRDIPPHDRLALESAIAKELNDMQRRYPNTTINVLCGLAEGADQLVANVALSQKFNVIAVLPFEVSEYQKDFRRPEALAEFNRLLQQCSEIKICQTNVDAPRDQGYIALGRTLVSCADIMFALWDGVIDMNTGIDTITTLPGGTADVVKMCVEGIMDESSLLFSKPNKTYCKWLVSNRTRHSILPDTISSTSCIGTWKTLPIAGNQDDAILKDLLCKTERFNLEASFISQQDKDKSIAYMLRSVENMSRFDSISKLIDVYSIADCLAQAGQKKRVRALKLITVLSFLAIIAQQIYVGLYATVSWFIVHMVLVLIVIAIYRMFFVGTDSKEEQFVEWRVFAEDLRVQIFWHIAGISEHSAKNYRTTKLYEMDWIVDNLNKLMFSIPDPKSHDVEFVKKQWIVDQRNYFYGQRGERGRAAQLLTKSTQYKNLSLVFFVLAMLLMLFSAVNIQLELLTVPTNPVLFIIIALAFISSALVNTFATQMGYEELSQRYLRTGYFFQQALNRMTLLDMQSVQGQEREQHLAVYQKVIKTIGVEALNENAAWLQLHKMNAYQIQVN